MEMVFFSLFASNVSSPVLPLSPPPPLTASVTSTKTTERLSFKGKRFLIHRDSGISLSPAASTSRNGEQLLSVLLLHSKALFHRVFLAHCLCVLKQHHLQHSPTPSYSKSSPSFTKKASTEVLTMYTTASPVTAVSRVVYPKECYRPLDNVSSFETDNEDLSIVEDDSTERSVTPPSMASCPEAQRPVFTVDGNVGETSVPKSKNSESSLHLSSEQQSNGRMSDIVRKISASILSSDRRKKPGSLVVEALKKSASSSNIVESGGDGGGASSESSSSVVSEEKVKKKKFFQTLRHRKPKA
ncbi:SOAR domain-containing protein [Caerostris darwini]|uniref:SOAR domain-containing protein n=1 Tax=Caerostris darwini TaxID=1538125 RepID=A0AAV4U485_9ARAC|nr:SOAR domain-containing protein [Caerostris darwini]